MSILNVRKALAEGAGPEFTFSDVTLGYANGGRQQVLNFKFVHNRTENPLPPGARTEIMQGSDNPVVKAREIGAALAGEAATQTPPTTGEPDGNVSVSG